MNRPRWSPWMLGSTMKTPSITSLSLMVGMLRSLLHVDLAVIADHQPAGARPDLTTGHDGLLADQAVLEARDVGDPAARHDDRVLDLAVGHRAVGADGAEGTDEAVDDLCAGADGDGAAHRGVDDARAGLDDDSPVDRRS